MLLYVYVPNEDLNSVKKHGLLGARDLYRLNPSTKKYITQYRAAIDEYPDLANFVKNIKSLKERILMYLDWRIDEKNGSNAIYALYYPIPDFANAFMHEFLQNRTLITVKSGKVYPIGGAKPTPSEYNKIWVNQIRNGDKNRLWFQGIPHCYTLTKIEIISININYK